MTTATSAPIDIHEVPILVAPEPIGQLRLQVIRDSKILAASRTEWNRLVGEHPFLCWEWIHSWWQVYGSTREAVVLVAVDECGRWVGLFPLCIERQRFWGRVLVNMASGRACSDHIRPIIATGYEKQVLELIADWIHQQSVRGAFDSVDWDGLDVGDPVIEQLLNLLTSRGFARRDLPIESSWIVELPEDWAVFEKSIKKCFRRKLQKARRNEQLSGVEIRTLSCTAEVRENWPTIVRLHELRRTAMSQLGCFQELGFSEFLLAALSQMADRGGSLVHMAEREGCPFGMIVVLRTGRQAFLYQSGFDPAQRQLEPGHLMATVAVRGSIEAGLTHFDFLRGDEPYKARWNTVRQPMFRVRLVAQRWIPQCRLKLWTIIRSIKVRLGKQVAKTLDEGNNDVENRSEAES